MNLRKKSIILLVLFFLAGFLLVRFCLSAGFGEGVTQVSQKAGLTTVDFKIFLANAVKGLLTLAGMIFVAIFIYGGVLYMVSQGSEDKVKKARTALTSAVIGIIIVMSGYSITYFIALTLEGGAGVGFREECETTSNQNYYSLDCCEYRFAKYGSVSPTCCQQSVFCGAHSTTCLQSAGITCTAAGGAKCDQCGAGVFSTCSSLDCMNLSTPEYPCGIKVLSIAGQAIPGSGRVTVSCKACADLTFEEKEQYSGCARPQ